jgi:fructose-1,6-bisphosphatase
MIANFCLVHLVTSKNDFGKQQSDIDLAADDIIFKFLKETGVVYAAASEEKPRVSET